MVTTQPTTKAALSIKTYRTEPSHRFEEDRKAETHMTSRKHTLTLPPPVLLLSNLHTLHLRLLTHNPNNTQHRQLLQAPTNDIQELKAMMKGPMEQMGTMLNLLTTLFSEMP